MSCVSLYDISITSHTGKLTVNFFNRKKLSEHWNLDVTGNNKI